MSPFHAQTKSILVQLKKAEYKNTYQELVYTLEIIVLA